MDLIAKEVRDYYDEVGEKFQPSFEIDVDDLVTEIVNKAKYVNYTNYVKFEGYELIKDARKVGFYERREVKKKKGRGKKKVKTKPIDRRYIYKLVLTFRHVEKDPKSTFTQVLYLPMKVDKYHYSLNGMRLYLLNQVIDHSTFTHDGDIVMKSAVMPIRLKRNKLTLQNSIGREKDMYFYTTHMFDKECNALYYILAKYGLNETLLFLEVEDYISISKQPLGKGYYSFKLYDSYINCDMVYFKEYEYCRNIVGTFYNAVQESKYDKMPTDKQWKIVLGGVFKANNASDQKKLTKCEKVLISYDLGLDDTTKSVLCDKIEKKHIQNTETLFRWMMQNYNYLLMKSNYDFKNKRVRKAEFVADQYGRILMSGIRRILNTVRGKNKDFIEGAITNRPDCILMALRKSQKVSTFDDSVNDMDGWTPFKYTQKGPKGVPNKVPKKMRKLHPSQVGITDLNTTSGSDPGLSGIVCPLRKFDSLTFDKTPEPQIYENRIRTIQRKMREILKFKKITNGINPFKKID